MENLNHSLFLFINATHTPNIVTLTLAKLFANYVVFLALFVLLAGWLRGDTKTRKLILTAAAASLLSLMLSFLIGLIWPHPRPFAIGLGRLWIPHAATASFPSNHLSLFWSISFSLLSPRLPTATLLKDWHRPWQQKNLLGTLHWQKTCGILLSLLGLPIAWARVYLGVHFPFDMLGAALIACCSAGLCYCTKNWLTEPLFQYTLKIYQYLFAPLIRRGWVLK